MSEISRQKVHEYRILEEIYGMRFSNLGITNTLFDNHETLRTEAVDSFYKTELGKFILDECIELETVYDYDQTQMLHRVEVFAVVNKEQQALLTEQLVILKLTDKIGSGRFDWTIDSNWK